MNEKTKVVLKEILQWVGSIVIAVVIAILIRAFVFEPVIVDGASMENTLIDGQRVILSKISKIEVGEVIVLKANDKYLEENNLLKESKILQILFPTALGDDFVKRIVGEAGDKIFFDDDGYLYVNDILIEEPYIKEYGVTRAMSLENPYIVPADHYYVLGDNRNKSSDSRIIGPIDVDDILGQVVFRIWPISEIGKID